MPYMNKAAAIAMAAGTLLTCTVASAQVDNAVAQQLQSISSALDRLTSTNMEILRRLDRIEARTQALPPLRQQVDQITTGQLAVLQQMQQLRNQVAASAAAAKNTTGTRATPPGPKLPLQMDIGPGRMEGDPNTTVVLVMFGDFQCSFCGRFYEDTLPKLREEFIEPGKMRFAMRDFTLPFHHDANRASVAVRCAEDQGKYWEMATSLHGHQNDLTTKSVEQQAKTVGLDMEAFNACVQSDKHVNDAKADMAKAAGLQISGTPTFAIGYSTAGASQLTITRVISGNKPLEQFRTAINDMFKEPLAIQQ
jgi:protein-disulfide isomerase